MFILVFFILWYSFKITSTFSAYLKNFKFSIFFHEFQYNNFALLKMLNNFIYNPFNLVITEIIKKKINR